MKVIFNKNEKKENQWNLTRKTANKMENKQDGEQTLSLYNLDLTNI